MARPAAPTGLGTKAKRLWTSTTTTYELREDELRILEDACREVDLVERLERELKKAKLTVEGSMGQPVANPLMQEIRQHRSIVQRLLGSLKLPDDEAGEGTKISGAGERSSKARDAASERWKRGA